MSSLMDWVEGASNDYHDFSRGIVKESDNIGIDDDGIPYCKTRRFSNNYSSQSPYAYWNIRQKPDERYINPHIAESSRTALQSFVSKEVLAEKFKPIYGREFKKLLWDMYVNDYIAAEGTNIRSWAGFANQNEISLMPVGNKLYKSTQELETDLDKAMPKTERDKLIEYIEKVNHFTEFRYYQQDLVKQAMVGGVAALFIETWEKKNDYDLPIGTPAVIKPLHWSFLDQVRVDTATWKFDSVRYTDFENAGDNGPNFVPGNRLIYVTRNDHMITPNNLFYGLSDYHSIWKLSNIVRQCEEVDFPEIVTSMYSSPGIFKFRNMNTDEIDDFMSTIGPGTIRGFNSNVDFVPVPLKHDGWFLMTLIQNAISHMLMKLRVPEFLFAFGGKNISRSDVEIQMNVFRDVVLSNDRWWMERHLNNQWYSHLIGLWTKELDPLKHKVRVVQNYTPLNFEDILAKANSLELLVRRYFIDIHEGRQFLGLQPYNKNIDERVNPIGQLLDIPPIEKIKFEQQQELQQQKAEQQQKTMDDFQNKNPNSDQKPLPTGQAGFQPATERANSSRIGTAGAGRGNKT